MRHELRKTLWCTGALALMGVCGGVNAQPATPTQAPRMHVQVAQESCPDAAQVREQLLPLLEPDRMLVIEDAPASTGDDSAIVVDHGARYSVQIGAAMRELDDAARDCVERARVAAVFIELNAKHDDAAPAPVVTTPPPKPAEPAAPPAEAREPEASGWRSAVGLMATGSLATNHSEITPGFGLEVSLVSNALRFSLGAAVSSTLDMPLAPASSHASVALLRAPLALTVGYMLGGERLQAGPLLGFETALLHLRGVRVPGAQQQLRVAFGGRFGLAGRAQLASSLHVLLRVSTTFFPRAYEVSVEPLGPRGSTPRLWLDAGLGLEWTIR